MATKTELPPWPPEHRCENCGWWKRLSITWFDKLLCFIFRIDPKTYEPVLGHCLEPKNYPERPVTSRVFICEWHTSGAFADLRGSFESRRRMGEILAQRMRDMKGRS